MNGDVANDEQFEADMQRMGQVCPKVTVIIDHRVLPFLIMSLQLASSHPRNNSEVKRKMKELIDGFIMAVPPGCKEVHKMFEMNRKAVGGE